MGRRRGSSDAANVQRHRELIDAEDLGQSQFGQRAESVVVLRRTGASNTSASTPAARSASSTRRSTVAATPMALYRPSTTTASSSGSRTRSCATSRRSIGSNLWPAQPRMRAEADQWMDWSHSLWTALRPAFLGLIRTPPEQAQRSRHRGIAAQDRRARCDSSTCTSPRAAYLAGDDFTIGDIPAGCAIWRWLAMPIERPARPHVARWFERLGQRRAYVNVVMSPLT